MIIFISRKGSVIAVVSISFHTTFSQNPSIVVEKLNEATTIAGHKFDKSSTKVKGIVAISR